jgi:hypothetical protein
MFISKKTYRKPLLINIYIYINIINYSCSWTVNMFILIPLN